MKRAHQDDREVADVHQNRQEAAFFFFPFTRCPDRPSSARCAEVFIRIAERYVAEYLQTNDLQRERDVQMIVRDIPAPSRDKTFANNQMSSSSQQKRKHENSCMDMCH